MADQDSMPGRYADRIPAVKAYLTKRFGPLKRFERFTSPHPGMGLYPVAVVETASETFVVKWYKKADKAEREYRTAQFLMGHGLLMIPIRELVADEMLLLMDFAPGREAKQSDFDAVIIEEAAQLLKQMHIISLNTPGSEQIPSWPGTTFQEEMTIKPEENLAKTEAELGTTRVHEIRRAFTDLSSRLQYQGKKGLCRRDLHAGNWFLHQDGHLYLLDYGMITFCDVAFDIHQVQHSLFGLEDQPSIGQFREAYGAADFDAANDPVAQAIVSLVHGLGIVWWTLDLVPPQPKFQLEGLALIDESLAVARTQTER